MIDHLLPNPRQLRIDDESSTLSVDRLTTSLRTALAPWLAAARDAAASATLACVLLRHLADGHLGDETAEAIDAERQAVRAAQDRAEEHYPNVLRTVLPRFVFEVLARAGVENIVPPSSRRVCVLIGANPVPGDRDLSERLTARGFDVHLLHDGDDARAAEPDLLIVTPGASAEAATAVANAPLPILAWGRHDTLGLSTASSLVLAQDTINIAAPGDALAAGLHGPVRVYRGPGKLSWCEPGAEGVVIARTLESNAAVIVHYAEGARIANGNTAPADRVAFFLSADGLAPWLIAPEGYALFLAAVDTLSEARHSGADAAPSLQTIS